MSPFQSIVSQKYYRTGQCRGARFVERASAVVEREGCPDPQRTASQHRREYARYRYAIQSSSAGASCLDWCRRRVYNFLISRFLSIFRSSLITHRWVRWAFRLRYLNENQDVDFIVVVLLAYREIRTITVIFLDFKQTDFRLFLSVWIIRYSRTLLFLFSFLILRRRIEERF